MKINIQKIKKEMERNGWNYSKLANEMKISRSRLSLVLGAGYRWNNFKMIERFARALNLDPKDLLL